MQATEEGTVAEANRRIIQDALNAAEPGTTVNIDELPLLRDPSGETPVAPLFCVPRSAVLTESEVAAIELEQRRS
jgi:hypothetical protein